MKTTTLLLSFLFLFLFNRQQTTMQHGRIFGTKPDTTSIIRASHLETFMANKARVSATIRGKVIKVTKQKGGWFEIDAGNGKIIAAHFSDYKVTIPYSLGGRYIIAEGIAEKQFIADDMQHMAGDTVNGKKQHSVKTNPKQKLTFEVKGLLVE